MSDDEKLRQRHREGARNMNKWVFALNSRIGGILTAMIIVTAGIVCAVTGYYMHRPPPDPMAGKYWIEFESLQGAVDSAGKLGGNYRGLTVCASELTIDKDKVWIPPSVAVSGNPALCAVSPRNSVAMATMQSGSTLSYATFIVGNHVP